MLPRRGCVRAITGRGGRLNPLFPTCLLHAIPHALLRARCLSHKSAMRSPRVLCGVPHTEIEAAAARGRWSADVGGARLQDREVSTCFGLVETGFLESAHGRDLVKSVRKMVESCYAPMSFFMD